jgi:tetratricopeptide (TPR) repeat protein
MRLAAPRFLAGTLSAAIVVLLPGLCCSQAPSVSNTERAALHEGPAWTTIAAHLPDPQTATPAQLELAGDVLRARRFPEDALDYYGYALARGGNVSELLNRMGIVRLELQQNSLAHELFLRTVRATKNDAQAWNNLGVTDYVAMQYGAAISEYKKASRLDKHSAIYHSNLAMVYFQKNDMDSARKELTTALRLNKHLMEAHDTGGPSLHVLGVKDYGSLCFEMARVYIRSGDVASMLLWLAKSSENGFDIKDAMSQDYRLHAYSKDPRVLLIIHNTAELHARSVAAARPPSLGVPDASINPAQQFD